jgi:hypothetical protein
MKSIKDFAKDICREGDCWVWRPNRKSPYGKYWDGHNNVPAHRHAYELVNGPIPEGMTIDHTCENPRCVNPDHLEPVPLTENIHRRFERSIPEWERDADEQTMQRRADQRQRRKEASRKTDLRRTSPEVLAIKQALLDRHSKVKSR